MRKKTLLLYGVAAALSLQSCFKDEEPNAEADIEQAILHADDVDAMFFSPTDTLINVWSNTTSIKFSVRRQTDLSALAPTFVITEGATINPASGSVHDFSNGPVAYTVTSQDGHWQRTYQVEVAKVVKQTEDVIAYDFENYELEPEHNKYYVWANPMSDGSLSYDWASGNGGFAISKSSAKPDEYPTVPITDGYEGCAVKLTTRSTGAFGKMKNMPLAAGNLYLGDFDVKLAITNTLHATRFGLPFDKKPERMTGYYKYKPGPNYQDRQEKIVADKTDKAAIYAVLYRNHDDEGNAVVLFGENVKSVDNPQIVALADMSYVPPTDEWTAFDINFNFWQELDPDLLANRGYSLAVVCSSSSEGEKFEGAIGSCLMIDKVRVYCVTEN